MPDRYCEACGAWFHQRTGRPARFCPEHRKAGDRYGNAHRRMRSQTVADWVGRPCVRCGKPLMDPANMHLDHDEFGGYLGYSHGSCNTRAGQRKGQAGRAAADGRRPVPVGHVCSLEGCHVDRERCACGEHSRGW